MKIHECLENIEFLMPSLTSPRDSFDVLLEPRLRPQSDSLGREGKDCSRDAKHFRIVLATRTRGGMVLSKDNAVASACSFIQNSRFGVVMAICEEVGNAV